MGATKEFIHSQELRFSCFDENRAGLTVDAGIKLIESAIRKMENMGIENSRYVGCLLSMRELQ